MRRVVYQVVQYVTLWELKRTNLRSFSDFLKVRRIQLFLKNNRAIATDDKITAVLAQLREGIAEIYVQKKIDQIEEEV